MINGLMLCIFSLLHLYKALVASLDNNGEPTVESVEVVEM